MVKRNIIEINNKKCNGCGLCIPNCPEGALQIIDGKVRLVSDLFCDGLGACIGHCPQGAIKVVKREAEKYDERKVMANIVKQGPNTIKAHLEHLKDHNEKDLLKQATNYLIEKKIKNPLDIDSGRKQFTPCACPGSAVKEIKVETKKDSKNVLASNQTSELSQWPIQLHLLPPSAPFFSNADLLIVADCVGFANPRLHQELIKGKAIAIGCPKLDDDEAYKEKIQSIIEMNNIKSVTVAIMEVPCCGGLYAVAEQAIIDSKKKVPLRRIVVGINGETKK